MIEQNIILLSLIIIIKISHLSLRISGRRLLMDILSPTRILYECKEYRSLAVIISLCNNWTGLPPSPAPSIGE